MHVIFESKLLSWRGGDVNATLQNPLAEEIRKHWVFEVPLRPLAGTLPPFEWTVKRPKIHPDNYWNAAGYALYHQRLIDVIAAFGVRYELFPAIVRDRQTHQPVVSNYHVFRLLETATIIDDEQSTLLENTTGRSHLVPHTPVPQDLPPLCRDTTHFYLVFVHPTVQRAVDYPTRHLAGLARQRHAHFGGFSDRGF